MMERTFKEGVCPKCQEKIQVPDDREKIICMYCGEEIRTDLALGIEREEDEAACSEKREQVLQGLFKVIKTCEKPFQDFKKDRYPGILEAFGREYWEMFQGMEYLYRHGKDPEGWVREMAEYFVKEAGEDLSAYTSKGKRNRRQLDLNFLVSIYLVPAMLNQKGEVYEPFADRLIADWNEAYGTTLGKARYEDIAGGFRRKLCYVTTAICESLNKGSDCYELRLLKEYRDWYLDKTDEGHALVEEYYDIAPTIVKRVDRLSERDEVYRELYERYIGPCVEDIENRRYEACGRRYQGMVEELKKRFIH